MIQKKNIALMMGGDSGEYEVSLASAAIVRKHLDNSKYNVYPILLRSTNWFYHPEEITSIPIDLNDFSLTLDGNRIKFDCVFIAIHGSPGEDGKLQGILDIMRIPYTSCDLTTSSITFNKYFCNDLAIQYGMNVARTIMLRRFDQWNVQELIAEVGLPCFVKPNKSGSSVGVTKVYDAEGFSNAVENAFGVDDEVLVQEFIKGREMACGVFRSEKGLHVLPVTEIISKKDFFDYEAKYTVGFADEITPADLTIDQLAECQRITAELYNKFNCKGVVRFDYFLSEEKWWFLEVNTIPGFSAESIVPKQAIAAGFSLSEFFGMLVDKAILDSGRK